MTFRHLNKFASKLSPEKVYTIRQRFANREATQIQLAQDYRVSIGTIRNIVKGVTWQDIPLVESEAEQESKIIRSQQLLAEILDRPAEQSPAEPKEDPFEEMLRRRGGADPLARRPAPTETEETRDVRNPVQERGPDGAVHARNLPDAAGSDPLRTELGESLGQPAEGEDSKADG